MNNATRVRVRGQLAIARSRDAADRTPERTACGRENGSESRRDTDAPPVRESNAEPLAPRLATDVRGGAYMLLLLLLLLWALLQLAATAPAPAPAPAPVCLWNTSAARDAGLPGCCGWPDGCSCGCCQHNYSLSEVAWTNVGPAPPAAARNNGHASTMRFLSFYNECPVDLQTRRPTLPGLQPPAPTAAASADAFESLPLIFGMCLPQLPLWGCWRDQLRVITQHGSATMIHVRGSGTLICGSAVAATLHLCADDCSDLDSNLKPLWNGTCGLSWLRSWLQELKPHVAQGLIKGFFVGDELVIDGFPLNSMDTVAKQIHVSLGVLDHFVYTNEGCHNNGPVGWDSIPPSLDIISIDGYHAVCADTILQALVVQSWTATHPTIATQARKLMAA